MVKKNLALLLCSAVTVTALAGCGDKAQKGSDNKSSSTMEIPKDGWTMDELLSVTYLCGKRLSYPLTVDSLGKDFTVGSDVLDLGDRFPASLNYKGQFFAPCIFGSENNTLQDLKYFSAFAVDMPENTEGFSFSINDAGFDSTPDMIQTAIGTPDKQNNASNSLVYYDREDTSRNLMIIFSDDRPVEFSFNF